MPRSILLRATVALAGALALGGCVFESPYWYQTFETTTTEIPIQTWTVDNTRPVRIECTANNHTDPIAWTFVTNLAPSENPSFDPQKGVIYSAGRLMSLPRACWAQENTRPYDYKTSLRATQATSSGGTRFFAVFDTAGLECLGREVGIGRSWFTWLSKNCAKTFVGGDDWLRWVTIKASRLGSASASPAPMSGRSIGNAPAASSLAAAARGAKLQAAARVQPRVDELAQRLGADPYDAKWAVSEEARLRAAFDAEKPEGTQLMEANCRSTMCRVDVLHRDVDAQRRFVATMAPLGLFTNDGHRGAMHERRDAAGLQSSFFIVRDGYELEPSVGEAAR